MRKLELNHQLTSLFWEIPTCLPLSCGLKTHHSRECLLLVELLPTSSKDKTFEASTMNEVIIVRKQNVWPENTSFTQNTEWVRQFKNQTWIGGSMLMVTTLLSSAQDLCSVCSCGDVSFSIAIWREAKEDIFWISPKSYQSHLFSEQAVAPTLDHQLHRIQFLASHCNHCISNTHFLGSWHHFLLLTPCLQESWQFTN